MALARRAGNRVVCVSATRGEHGTDDPVRWPPARLARTRDHEVAAAMAVLGVDDHRCLDFEDGTLADIDAEAGAELVRTLIADVVPDTIATFGPEGMTGHPDHCAIAAWVRAASDGSTSMRVLQATTTAAFVDEFADIHDAVVADRDVPRGTRRRVAVRTETSERGRGATRPPRAPRAYPR